LKEGNGFEKGYDLPVLSFQATSPSFTNKMETEKNE
jgi:hypothetical protein